MAKIVTIDARWLVGGIGTYTANLLSGLAQHANGLEFHAIARRKDAARVGEWCSHVKVVNAPIYTLREQFLVPRAAEECDLLHVPHYNAPVFYRGPLLVSIMDVIHISFPAYRSTFASAVYARPMLNWVARKAVHVVTVSEYSKAEIVRALGIPASKITVIHCGVDNQFYPREKKEAFDAIRRILPVSGPYLLYVGNLKPHKNILTLLRAFAQWRARGNTAHSLVIVGEDARWRPSLLEECVALGIRDCTIFVPYVSQELLPKLYAAADALIMPSTVEGFGLPVLEAMASGTPVICSNAASLPEVAGEAALYFDPARTDDLANAIGRLLLSRELRECLRGKGLKRARQFSWHESTGKHIELYNRLLEGN